MAVGGTGRRWLGPKPQIIGRPPEDYARDLQRVIDRLWDSDTEGIPAGFKDVLPEPIGAGATADAGTETEGWAAADHVHAPVTGSAVALDPASTSSEGTGSALARAAHTHDVSALVDESMVMAIIFGG